MDGKDHGWNKLFFDGFWRFQFTCTFIQRSCMEGSFHQHLERSCMEGSFQSPTVYLALWFSLSPLICMPSIRLTHIHVLHTGASHSTPPWVGSWLGCFTAAGFHCGWVVSLRLGCFTAAGSCSVDRPIDQWIGIISIVKIFAKYQQTKIPSTDWKMNYPLIWTEFLSL